MRCGCRGDLLGTLQMLDEEEDINKILNFFSYEHFYVIYCKARNQCTRISMRPRCAAARSALRMLAYETCESRPCTACDLIPHRVRCTTASPRQRDCLAVSPCARSGMDGYGSSTHGPTPGCFDAKFYCLISRCLQSHTFTEMFQGGPPT